MAKHYTTDGVDAARTGTEPVAGAATPTNAPTTPRRHAPKPTAPTRGNGSSGGGANVNGRGYGGGDGRPDFGGGREGFPIPLAKVGLGVVMGPMAILFAALVSAYVVRMGLGGWDSVSVGSFPSLWISTVFLVLASITLVRAGRRTREGAAREARRDLALALGLGTAFLVSQATGWLALQDAGFFVATNPASSFIYLLTGFHALHILGGLGALVRLLLHRGSDTAPATNPNLAGAAAGGGTTAGSSESRNAPASPSVAVETCGLYWHFLLAVWLVFFALMLVT